ncbi:MAG: hypothetical protein FE78DRAFT_136335, partial [Acidomyces sp. 'richmondensis']
SSSSRVPPSAKADLTPSNSAVHSASSRSVTPISSSSNSNFYLIIYNSVSALLWSVALGRTLLGASVNGYDQVYAEIGTFTKWTQTLAGLEVLHALIGLVRAPLLTTLMQVASRYLLVWGIVNIFPQTASHSLAYTTMLIAWSTTEIIRYSYFALNLAYGKVPGLLTWLRYNTFFVLYPLGISSECWLVWLSTEPARRWTQAFEWGLWAVLVIYIPGSYVLYTHMMTQRKKVLRNLKSKKGA